MEQRTHLHVPDELSLVLFIIPTVCVCCFRRKTNNTRVVFNVNDVEVIKVTKTK